MRQIDSTIKARALLNLQTTANNANPSMETVVSRPRTPIFDKRFWQETIIQTSAMIACTSVAVRRVGKTADKVYAAYVTNLGTLVVKSALITYPISNMSWSVELTISNCVACALEFDGSFVRVGRDVEYRTESIPWLFYTTTSGELNAGLLGGSFETLVSSNVLAIDVVRGIASRYKDIDQGLIVFYVFDGSVYYQQLIDGVWQGQEPVDIAPENAVQIKVERLFDYRICLHVTDTSGALWEVFTKMTASGWNGHEYLSAAIEMNLNVTEITYYESMENEYISVGTDVTITALYGLSPLILRAENYANVEGDYGYLIRLTFDELVFGTTGNEYQFTLTDSLNTVFHCDAIINNGRELLLTFPNLNNVTNPVVMAYTPGTVMGEVVALDADSISITLTGLVPTYVPPPVVLSIENTIDWMEIT